MIINNNMEYTTYDSVLVRVKTSHNTINVTGTRVVANYGPIILLQLLLLTLNIWQL